jgi:predicted DNA-binding mobile mystery protein A
MNQAANHLDQRFQTLAPLTKNAPRPSHGWIRAIRDALGLTTAQLARRMGVSQPRVIAIEKAEQSRTITLKTLERAAEALDCRVVYVFVPVRPLEETLQNRASAIADKRLSAVNQTMRLENQSVSQSEFQQDLRNKLVRELLEHPARLWDDVDLSV